MSCSLSLKNLYFSYDRQPLFDGLNLSIEGTGIIGLLGLNGQGKSTLLKILSGVLPASIETTCSTTDRHLIGYLPERPQFYPELTVYENICFSAEINGVKQPELHNRVSDTIRKTQLAGHSRQLAGTLSKGYQQRLGLAMATVHEPRFLILDEPTDGLDPRQVEETQAFIRDYASNACVVISSHRIDEISRLCMRMLILHQGSLVDDSLIENDEQRQNLTAKFHQLTGQPQYHLESEAESQPESGPESGSTP